MKEISWADYISSPYWKRFSKKILDDMDVKCAITGKVKWSIYKKKTKKHKAGDKKRNVVLTLHHRTYTNLGHNFIHDLERMCSKHPAIQEAYDIICKKTPWRYEKAETMMVPDDFVLKKTRVKKTKKTKSK
jgi:hypothetical protein